ncbi:MAG: glutathione S-transferase [Lysobacterales bacterium]|jgi:glutathione S-transferase
MITGQKLPILYSFNRCPYAIRARMTLNYAGVEFELREVSLKDKPASMLKVSAKGSVPVLVLPDGDVINESADVMHWALRQNDPDRWWREELADQAHALLEENDFNFKVHLDHYKYADRFPEKTPAHYRTQGERFLQQLESELESQPYLFGDQITFSDVAVFPFIRQFSMIDIAWFDQAPYPNLQAWLHSLINSLLFTGVMNKLPFWYKGAPALIVRPFYSN